MKRLNYACTKKYRILVSTEITEDYIVSAYSEADAKKIMSDRLAKRKRLCKLPQQGGWSWGDVDIMTVEEL